MADKEKVYRVQGRRIVIKVILDDTIQTTQSYDKLNIARIGNIDDAEFWTQELKKVTILYDEEEMT